MARDLSLEPLFTLSDIQGDILLGLPKRVERLIFFTIVDAGSFKKLLAELPVTSAGQVVHWIDEIKFRKTHKNHALLPTPGLNVAFTFHGLTKLGVKNLTSAETLKEFCAGMTGSRKKLSDPSPGLKTILKTPESIDGVFILTGSEESEINNVFAQRFSLHRLSWVIIEEKNGIVRPGTEKGHEHFGFADGVSQPGMRGRISTTRPLTETVDHNPKNDQGALGQDLLWPGEFLLGQLSQDPCAKSFASPGISKLLPHPMMGNGSFLVFRKLSQKVPEFDRMLSTESEKIVESGGLSSPDLLGAQLVGRWKNGAALVQAPTVPNDAIASGTPDENAFEFGEDRDGFKCPWAAHVRKAYPRDDFLNGKVASDEEEAKTQTHRMMRRGIAYGPEISTAEAEQGVTHEDRGLLFKCYVSSIKDQFEFVQEFWMNNPDFSQHNSGVDPLTGQGASSLLPFRGACPMTEKQVDKPDLNLNRFIHFEGGEYFFSPAISQLITGFQTT